MVARRLWLIVQTSFLGVICAFGPPRALSRIASDIEPARAAPQSQSSGDLQLQNSSARTLHLQDSTWKQIRVEVRVGPNTSCDAFVSLGVQVLQQGQEWEVQFDDPVICWRHDQTPGDPMSKWAAWHLEKLADGETRVLPL